jgi:hypothetical protein
VVGFAIGVANYEIQNHTLWWDSKASFSGAMGAGTKGAVTIVQATVAVVALVGMGDPEPAEQVGSDIAPSSDDISIGGSNAPLTVDEAPSTTAIVPYSTNTTLAPYYPPHNGFASEPDIITLHESDSFIRNADPTIDDSGRYASPPDTPAWARSLPPDKQILPETTYNVIKPIYGVSSGPATAWFGQLGGGTQYMLPASIQYYIDKGFVAKAQ